MKMWKKLYIDQNCGYFQFFINVTEEEGIGLPLPICQEALQTFWHASRNELRRAWLVLSAKKIEGAYKIRLNCLPASHGYCDEGWSYVEWSHAEIFFNNRWQRKLPTTTGQRTVLHRFMDTAGVTEAYLGLWIEEKSK